MYVSPASRGLTREARTDSMASMRVELEPAEASVASRYILALQAVQAQAQAQIARINAKLADLESQIRTRLPDLPDTPISSWQWDLDPVEGTGAALIGDDT